MSTEEGEITYNNGCVKWNIKKFREVWEKRERLESPTFIYSGRVCYILLNCSSNKEITLEFHECSPLKSNLYIEFILYTQSIRSGLIVMKCLSHILWPSVCISFKDFLSKETSTPLDDYLTVMFWVFELNGSILIPKELKEEALPASVEASEIKSSYQKEIHSKKEALSASVKASEIESSYQKEINSRAINNLLEDLKSLRVSGENSDVKLVVRGKEFPAHRLILSARSPVFKAMLCHDTSEKESGTVNIDDCDPHSFQDFLDHVYTGSTKNVNTGNMISLYATSDKYFMRDLKDVCVSLMKANMSVERFCGVATLALLHAEKELLEFSKDFFFKNSKTIIESKNWETFFDENPKEAYEHFMKPLISRR